MFSVYHIFSEHYRNFCHVSISICSDTFLVFRNMRDKATLNQLLVLADLKSYNAVLITQDFLEIPIPVMYNLLKFY